MSLLTQASLITTPTAYKASTLYSIVPSSGNGDLTVTRATTATRTNSSGIIETVASNVPRIDYTSGVGSILLEPQRTNVLLNSATLSTQSVTTTAVSYALSFYGTGTINLSGAYTGSLAGTGASNRVTLVFTSTAASLTLTVSGSCTNAQLEQGAYATSYIPTVGSTVTRNADVITRSDIYTNGLITSAGGTWFIELNNNLSLTRDTGGNLGIGTTSEITLGNSFTIRATGTSRLVIVKYLSGVFTSGYITPTDTVKIAIKWNGTTADIFVNGVKVISATAFTATAMEFFQCNAFDVPKYIKSTILFPTPLTDAECANLTTL